MLLGLIEGMGLLMNNFMSQQYRPVDPRCETPIFCPTCDYALLSTRDEQAMQMPEDPASLVIQSKISSHDYFPPCRESSKKGVC